ncbi:hypothetical protein [Deinococcus sp.]
MSALPGDAARPELLIGAAQGASQIGVRAVDDDLRRSGSPSKV